MCGASTWRTTVTFKERSDVPHIDASSLHELAQGNFQEEDGDSSNNHDQQVRDEEDACRKHGGRPVCKKPAVL